MPSNYDDSRTPGPACPTPSAVGQEPTYVSLADDRQLAYAEYGPPDGTPVVFMHGTPGSRLLGALLAPAAEALGVRLLAPDRPGYGHSTPWPNREIQDAAAFLTPVLDDAGVETAGLVAFSGGAPYALAMTATQSDRVTGVDIIAGATPLSVSDDRPAIQRVLTGLATRAPSVLSTLFRGQAFLADHLSPDIVVGQYTADPSTVPDSIAEIVAADFREAFATHRGGAVTEFRQTAANWGLDLDEIDTPFTCWHGTADTNVPLAGARKLTRTIPTAELQVLETADHLNTLLRCRRDVLEGYS